MREDSELIRSLLQVVKLLQSRLLLLQDILVGCFHLLEYFDDGLNRTGGLRRERNRCRSVWCAGRRRGLNGDLSRGLRVC